MEFIVTSRDDIECGVLVRSAYVIISIRDPQLPKARIRNQTGLRDVLCLAFDDAEPVASSKLPTSIKPMTGEQAKQIWEFVRKWEGKVGTIVVHCEQGMSRSPAVAAALCRHYGGDEGYFFQHHQPNLYVRRLMIERAKNFPPASI